MKQCFGDLGELKKDKCESEKCPVGKSCLNFALGNLVSRGLLVEVNLGDKLGYLPTEKGVKNEELIRAVWVK